MRLRARAPATCRPGRRVRRAVHTQCGQCSAARIAGEIPSPCNFEKRLFGKRSASGRRRNPCGQGGAGVGACASTRSVVHMCPRRASLSSRQIRQGCSATRFPVFLYLYINKGRNFRNRLVALCSCGFRRFCMVQRVAQCWAMGCTTSGWFFCPKK